MRSAGRGFPYSPGAATVTTAPRVSGPSNRPGPQPPEWPRVPPDRPVGSATVGGTPQQIPAGAHRAPRSAQGAGLRRRAGGDVQTRVGMCARQGPPCGVTCNTDGRAGQEKLCRCPPRWRKIIPAARHGTAVIRSRAPGGLSPVRPPRQEFAAARNVNPEGGDQRLEIGGRAHQLSEDAGFVSDHRRLRLDHRVFRGLEQRQAGISRRHVGGNAARVCAGRHRHEAINLIQHVHGKCLRVVSDRRSWRGPTPYPSRDHIIHAYRSTGERGWPAGGPHST